MINESLYPVPWLPAPPEHDQVRAWGLCWPISWFLATSDGGRTAPNPGATSQVYTAIASRRHWRCRAWIIINKMLKHVWRVFFKSLRDFVDKVNKIYRWRCWSEHVCCCDTGKNNKEIDMSDFWNILCNTFELWVVVTNLQVNTNSRSCAANASSAYLRKSLKRNL